MVSKKTKEDQELEKASNRRKLLNELRTNILKRNKTDEENLMMNTKSHKLESKNTTTQINQIKPNNIKNDYKNQIDDKILSKIATINIIGDEINSS